MLRRAMFSFYFSIKAFGLWDFCGLLVEGWEDRDIESVLGANGLALHGEVERKCIDYYSKLLRFCRVEALLSITEQVLELWGSVVVLFCDLFVKNMNFWNGESIIG
jgi:hypothetical protein